jgi:hypothetical protein
MTNKNNGGIAIPSVDALAQFIRTINGEHDTGADILAERICEWLKAAPQPEDKGVAVMADSQWCFENPYDAADHINSLESRLSDYEVLEAEYDRLTRYCKNGIDCFANPCERHSGEGTPPFSEFFERYGGQCLICVVDNNKTLQAKIEELYNALELFVAHYSEPDCPIARDVYSRALAALDKARNGDA